MAIKFASIDSTVSLLFALVINAAILILAAATFYGTEHAGVTDIADAYNLLTPLLGASFASIAFGIALLASGQSSTLTGTLAGQIVMEGFLKIRLPRWMIRVITRGLAIIPAMIVAILYGERGTGELLVFSQVILALQLGFAVVPLVTFTSDKAKMGKFVNPLWLTVLAWGITAVIISLNAYLVLQVFVG
jgi:manganese transport protein